MEPELIKDLIQHRIIRAKETLVDTEIAIKNDRLKNALNGIYYSAVYAVSALSVKTGFSTSKHKQLLDWFNKNFVHTGIISGDLFTIYTRALDLKQESDYEDYVEVDKNVIEENYKDMLKFVSEIEKVIEENKND